MNNQEAIEIGIEGAPAGRRAPSADQKLCKVFMDDSLMRKVHVGVIFGIS
ncbi:hypothetical protein [Bradyrhizobium macuxiense]|nr:hypothetical protein [Bradyrhizobium macuxiense]